MLPPHISSLSYSDTHTHTHTLKVKSDLTMASPTARLTFRILLAAAMFLILFYIGRPLYWKISATIHDIRHNKQTVSQGISQIMQEAQRSMGWFYDESDSGLREEKKST